jgi:hypothetical protein
MKGANTPRISKSNKRPADYPEIANPAKKRGRPPKYFVGEQPPSLGSKRKKTSKVAKAVGPAA